MDNLLKYALDLFSVSTSFFSINLSISLRVLDLCLVGMGLVNLEVFEVSVVVVELIGLRCCVFDGGWFGEVDCEVGTELETGGGVSIWKVASGIGWV